MQAYRQEPLRNSRDKASAQASAQAPSPDQLLRGAARKCPRPSAYAMTTPYALPSTTKPSPHRDLIQGRGRKPSRPSIVESPLQLPSQIPPQENSPPFRQPAGRLAPKRDHTIATRRVPQHREPDSKENRKYTRAPTQKGVQEPTQKCAGKIIHEPGKATAQLTADTVTGQPPRRYGQAICRTSSGPEPDLKVSQLPIRVTDKSSIQDPAGLATRRPIRVTSDLLRRESARVLPQGNIRASFGIPTPPLTTPSIDIPLAANQEVIVRVGKQSLSLRNIAGNLFLRVEDTWRPLDELVRV